MLFCYWILSQWLNLHWVTHQPLLLTAPLPNTAKPLIAIFTFSFYFGQRFRPLICAFLLIRNPGCNEEHNRSVSGRVLCACVVICDPHVDGENEHLWLLASLVVLFALKGRQTLSITPAVNNQPVFNVLTGEGLLYARCCRWVASMVLDALRKALQGDLGLCKPSPSLSPALNNSPSYLLTPELL